MAKVTARKETGKLVIDFTYRSVRCREQTALADTPQNRKRASAVVQRIKAAIVEGTFAYGDFFPGSALAMRFGSSGQVSALTPSVPVVVSATAAAAAEASAPAT
ncbi:MAG: hypothetical protein RL701_5979, partial [Pseudomonadota bacterium]